MAQGTWINYLTESHKEHKQEEVIFNQNSLEEFVKRIKTGIRDNYTIISLKTLYDKNNQNLTEDEQSIVDNLLGWDSKRFNEDVLINKLYPKNNSSRYTTFRIGDDISLGQGDKIGSVKFIKNGNSSDILIKGFTDDGHFNNNNSDFTIQDLSARNIQMTGTLTYGNSNLTILNDAEAQRRSLIQSYQDVTQTFPYVDVTETYNVIVNQVISMSVTYAKRRSTWSSTTDNITQNTQVIIGIIASGTLEGLNSSTFVSNKPTTTSIPFNAATVNTIIEPNSNLIGKCTIDGVDYYKTLTSTEMDKFCKKKIKFKSVTFSDKQMYIKTSADTYEAVQGGVFYDYFDQSTTKYLWIPNNDQYELIDKSESSRPGKTVFPGDRLGDTISNYQIRLSAESQRPATWNDVLEGSIITAGGIAAAKSIKGYRVHGAVFNDYAEYRHVEKIKPGSCVIEVGDGSLIPSTKRLQLGGNIVSDTYGFSIGETLYANTPIAVCGRVLAYPWENRETFKPGEAVCTGPNGTISRMTREEIRNWPDAIVGYVSEIPNYEEWGSDNIKVDGRIWIKVK